MTHLGKLIKTQIPVTCSKRGPGFRIQIQEILDRTLEQKENISEKTDENQIKAVD